MNLKEKLAAIQNDLKVKKSRYNSFGKYHYRAAEDILEALKPFELKYKVTFTVDEDSIGPMLIMTKAFIHDQESDDAIHATAIVGVEKAGGMALPQAFGSASSYGKKYALGNLLLIDDTADADATNDHGRNRFKQQVSNLEKSIGDSREADLGF